MLSGDQEQMNLDVAIGAHAFSVKLTAEPVKVGSSLSEALDVAEAQHIYLSEEWFQPPTIEFCIVFKPNDLTRNN